MNKIELTPYSEHVYVRISDLSSENKKPYLPEVYKNKLLRVKRTGSHTWQPITSRMGTWHHIYVHNVSEIYTKETHPEYFINEDIPKGSFIKIKKNTEFYSEGTEVYSKTFEVKYIHNTKHGNISISTNDLYSTIPIDKNLIEEVFTKETHPEYFL